MRAISEQMHNGVYCVVVQGNCAVCSKQKTLYIPESEWLDWRNDAGHIQDVLKSVSADDRELLLSGTCGLCFDAMFAGEDDE